MLRVGLIVAAFLAVQQTTDGAPSVTPTALAAPLAGDAAVGKQTFTQECSICHGAGARGFIGPAIAGINWTVPGLHAIVRFGVGGYGGMPAFNADVVTEKNIAPSAFRRRARRQRPPRSPSQPHPPIPSTGIKSI